MKTSTSLLCLIVAIAVLSSSALANDQKCAEKYSECKHNTVQTQTLFLNRQFCDYLKYKDGRTSTEACMVLSGACTQDQYNQIKFIQCGEAKVVSSGTAVVTETAEEKRIAKALTQTSKRCADKYSECKDNTGKTKTLWSDKKFCDYLKYTDAQTSTQKCMVVGGGCKQDEYNKIKKAACGATSIVVSLTAVVIGVFASMFGK